MRTRSIRPEIARDFVKQSLTDLLTSAGFDSFHEGPSEKGKSRTKPVFGAWRHREHTVDWLIVDFYRASRSKGAPKHCCFDLFFGKFFRAIPSCGKVQSSKAFMPSEGHFEGYHYGAIDYSNYVQMHRRMQEYVALLRKFLIPLFDHYEDIDSAVGTLMKTAVCEPIGMKRLNVGIGLFNSKGDLSPLDQYYLASIAAAAGRDEIAIETLGRLIQEEGQSGGLRFPGFHHEKYEEVQRRLAK